MNLPLSDMKARKKSTGGTLALTAENTDTHYEHNDNTRASAARADWAQS
jgi:hypothetical protein